jgi:predicted TIM-barrel fold metal-dependent hydrolase
MTTTEFFQLANTSISNNPQDRLPTDIKNTLNALPNDAARMMFDVHAHCFTLEHVPKGFMNLGWIRSIPFGMDVVAMAFKLARKIKKWFGGRNYDYYETYGKKRFLERFTKDKNSDEVLMYQFNRYNYAFDQVLHKERPHIFMVELMMDMQRGIGGAIQKPFYEQWKELSDLRQLRQHNKSLIPFLAVDPRNPNVYADFLAAFSDQSQRVNQTGQPFLDTAFPFFGVKIYPSLGYMPSDPILMDIFKVCAEKKIPVTTHCGGASVRCDSSHVSGNYYTHNGQNLVLKAYDLDLSAYKKSRQARDIARFFNAPKNWAVVATAYPNLKINLAHLGGSEEWDRYREGLPDTHVQETLDMIVQHPNVFTDISYAYATKANLEKLAEMLYSPQFSALQRDVFRTKFLHGSDYFMTDLEKSLITVMANFVRQFEHDKAMLNQICVHNPIQFLLR